MRITVNVNVPSGETCHGSNDAGCEWHYTHAVGTQECMLFGNVSLDGHQKCYDCLKACVAALEAGKEREDG
ncbi:hypothetical protein ACH6CV_16820 [Bacillota bacterium Meth-B3]